MELCRSGMAAFARGLEVDCLVFVLPAEEGCCALMIIAAGEDS